MYGALSKFQFLIGRLKTLMNNIENFLDDMGFNSL